MNVAELRRLLDGVADGAKIRVTLEGGDTIAIGAGGVDASGLVLYEHPRAVRSVPVEPQRALEERPFPRRAKR